MLDDLQQLIIEIIPSIVNYSYLSLLGSMQTYMGEMNACAKKL